MRALILAVLMVAAAGAGRAQAPAGGEINQIYDALRDSVFPQIASGGSWQTTITLYNMDTVPSTATIRFFNANGAMPLKFVGIPEPAAQLGIQLPINGSVVLQTEGDGPLQQGFALLIRTAPLGNGGKIGGVAVFRQRVAGRPDFEAAVPLSPITERRFRLFYDHTQGFATGVALVSYATDSSGNVINTPTEIEVEWWDMDGVRLGFGSLTVGPLGYAAFSLTDQIPALAGRRGIIEFRALKDFMGAIGLRFQSAGPFTTLPPASLPEWHRY